MTRDIILKAVQPLNEIIIPTPDSGFLGKFLEETENMLKARAMRMSGLLRRINESGQRTENLLKAPPNGWIRLIQSLKGISVKKGWRPPMMKLKRKTNKIL